MGITFQNQSNSSLPTHCIFLLNNVIHMVNYENGYVSSKQVDTLLITSIMCAFRGEGIMIFRFDLTLYNCEKKTGRLPRLLVDSF